MGPGEPAQALQGQGRPGGPGYHRPWGRGGGGGGWGGGGGGGVGGWAQGEQQRWIVAIQRTRPNYWASSLLDSQGAPVRAFLGPCIHTGPIGSHTSPIGPFIQPSLYHVWCPHPRPPHTVSTPFPRFPFFSSLPPSVPRVTSGSQPHSSEVSWLTYGSPVLWLPLALLCTG